MGPHDVESQSLVEQQLQVEHKSFKNNATARISGGLTSDGADSRRLEQSKPFGSQARCTWRRRSVKTDAAGFGESLLSRGYQRGSDWPSSELTVDVLGRFAGSVINPALVIVVKIFLCKVGVRMSFLSGDW